jgi:hypothetical protein
VELRAEHCNRALTEDVAAEYRKICERALSLAHKVEHRAEHGEEYDAED